MPIFSIIWSLITSRFGGWIVGGAAVLVVLGLLKWEHSAKLKAEAQLATAKTAAEISQQQLLLYQEREEIKSKFTKKRGAVNEWEKKGDLDSLVDDFNAPNGVRRQAPPNSSGGVKGPASYHDAADPRTSYQEAPGQ
jgi:hypothetical protein